MSKEDKTKKQPLIANDSVCCTQMGFKKKRSEEELKESEEKYRFLFEQSQTINILIGKDRKIVDVNKSALNSLGYKLREVIGKDTLKFVVPHHREEASKYLKQALKGNYLPSTSVGIKTKGGKRILLFAEGYARIYEKKEFAGILISAVDITERVNAEKALREYHESLLTILDSFTSTAIYASDMKSYEIIFANKYIIDHFGNVVGKKCYKVLHPDKTAPCEFCTDDKLINSKGEPNGVVYIWEFKNQITGRLYELHDKAIKWIDGRIVRFEIANDITNRKQMEEELLKMKKYETISLLAGGFAHDFNNLLTAIIGNISLANEGLAEKNKIAAEKLSEAYKASLKTKELVQRIILLSEGGISFKKAIDLREILKGCANYYLNDSNIKCEFKLPDTLWLINGDNEQISQAVSHLIENAIEASQNNGEINISAENIILDKEDAFIKSGRYVKCCIKDSGVGIPERNLPRIFDPYFTTKEMGSRKGTGLGLAICNSIIKNHSGFIKVASKVGSGTTFEIYLPAFKSKSIKGTEGKC